MKASIAVTALFLSVAVTAVSAQNGAPPRVPGIDTLGMDRSVRPQDDFYRFVNGAWDDKMAIPADRSYYGSLVEVGERAQEPVRGILEAEATKPQGQNRSGRKSAVSTSASMTRPRSSVAAYSRLRANWRPSAASPACAASHWPSSGRRSVAFAPRCPFASRRIHSVPTSTPSSSRRRASACPTATKTSVPTSSSLRCARQTSSTSAGS